MKKIVNLIFIFFVFILLFCLFLFANRIPNKISEKEKRVLANLPNARFYSTEYKNQLTNYLEDNIYGRDFFISIRNFVNSSIFHIKPVSEKVEYGKEGWLFYNLDYNIQIAKGTYPLNNDKLRQIAETQQSISDYYKSKGKNYILIIEPSKVSIYPEYLYGNYTIRETPCDIIYKYLKENTTVQIIDMKSYFLKHKNDGQLYWKDDTHWTPLGYYTAYKCIIDNLNDFGFTETNFIPFCINDKEESPGDLINMLGITTSKDSCNNFKLQTNARQVSNGDFYDKLKQTYKSIYSDNQIDSKFVLYENQFERKNLLIYADSQYTPVKRNIPSLLGNSFNHVLYIWSTDINDILENYYNSDIVIYSQGERHVSWAFDHRPYFLDLNELPELPIKENFTNEWGEGVFFGAANDTYLGNKSDLLRNIILTNSTVIISGWALDFQNSKVLNSLYIKVGEKIIKTNYGINRPDVSQFIDENLNLSGFISEIPSTIFIKEDGELVKYIEFIMVSDDEAGAFMYKPIKYEIN